MKELATIMETEHTTEVEKRSITSSILRFMRLRYLRVVSSGAERMDRIVHLATTMPGYELSFFQRCCMDAILPIVAPVVFKGCPAHEMGEYFTKKRWIATLMRMIFLEISRRSGKSDLLALLAAIFLVVLPQIEMLGWSLYNDTSALFGRTMAKWLVDLKYGPPHSSVSDGHVILKTEHQDDIRVMYLMGSQNPNVSLLFFFYFYFYICCNRAPPKGGLFSYICMWEHRTIYLFPYVCPKKKQSTTQYLHKKNIFFYY
jgi:hypothetical protein